MRYQFARFVVDVDARLLQCDGTPLHLSPKAFDLLAHLIAERPRAVPRQELYDRLWPDTYVVDTNLPVLIGEIRQALDDRERETIRTVHRHGYAFTAEVREMERTAIAPHVLIHGSTEYQLLPGDNVIGREAGVEVRIVSPRLSRKHALITIGEEATLRDLGSKNGTFLDGRQVESPVILIDGALISFGTIDMVYRRVDDGTTLTAV